jgi:hypothetical protein
LCHGFRFTAVYFPDVNPWHEYQVGKILKDLEEELDIKPIFDWIPKANFLANLKNPFKIGLLMGPDSPEVDPMLYNTC